jgi:hypothetical protein
VAVGGGAYTITNVEAPVTSRAARHQARRPDLVILPSAADVAAERHEVLGQSAVHSTTLHISRVARGCRSDDQPAGFRDKLLPSGPVAREKPADVLDCI